MSLHLVAANAALLFGMVSILWLISVVRRDVSIIDPYWSIGFLLVTVHNVLATGWTAKKALVVAAVALWAIRLWAHLVWRSRGQPEDPRYTAFRLRYGPARYYWVSFFQVFLLQGTLVLLISAPLQLAAAAPAPDPIRAPHLVGLALFLVGFTCEAAADAQLQAFRRDPTRRGQVLDTGLWRYSRHPNYFGEALLGWGLALFAAGQPYAWASLLAPLLMTFLLLKVSGVAMLDAHLSKTKPAYHDYILRTSAFLPWPPRRRSVDGGGHH